MMKKYTAMLLSLLLCLSLLAGCGKNYAVEESTLFILKNGKVISTDVEEFDSSYDAEALSDYINNAIKEYTDDYGEDSVTLKELTVEGGKATLIIEYASAGDYAAFTGVELFSGSVLDALSAGYTFDVDFASIKDGEATECSNNDIIEADKLKVIVFKGNVNVNVPGKIMFASVENTKLVDEKTIAIDSSYNLLGWAIDYVTEAEEIYDTEYEYDYDLDEEFEEDFGEDFEDTDFDEGSIDDELAVGEDDLLSQSTEEIEEDEEDAEFEFEDREEDLPDEVATYNSVYTYIIFK